MLPLTAPLKSPVAGPIVVFRSIAPKLVMSIPPTGTQRRSTSSGRPAAALDLGFPLAEANASNKSAEDRPNTILVTLRRVIRASLGCLFRRITASADGKVKCFPYSPIAKRRGQNGNSTTTIRRFAESVYGKRGPAVVVLPHLWLTLTKHSGLYVYVVFSRSNPTPRSLVRWSRRST